MHNAGEMVFPAIAAVEGIPWHDPGRSCPVVVTSYGLQAITMAHHALPLFAVGTWALTFVSVLPVHNQVGDFMRNRLLQVVIEVV